MKAKKEYDRITCTQSGLWLPASKGHRTLSVELIFHHILPRITSANITNAFTLHI